MSTRKRTRTLLALTAFSQTVLFPEPMGPITATNRPPVSVSRSSKVAASFLWAAPTKTAGEGGTAPGGGLWSRCPAATTLSWTCRPFHIMPAAINPTPAAANPAPSRL